MRAFLPCKQSLPSRLPHRFLHTSSRLLSEKFDSHPGLQTTEKEDTELLKDQASEENGAYEPTHLYMMQQREKLHYMRLIEHEMPKLVAYRKAFVPPTDSSPLVVRRVSYGGEEHPATTKRSIVAPVAKLPLKNAHALHKFKLLAGVRWTPTAPADAGLSVSECQSEHGFFKISCEEFKAPAMNLKWASDALDRLVDEANDTKETFADIPIDTRHVESRIRKSKKGGHIYGKQTHQPTLKDFPEEWLPTSKAQAAPSA